MLDLGGRTRPLCTSPNMCHVWGREFAFDSLRHVAALEADVLVAVEAIGILRSAFDAVGAVVACEDPSRIAWGSPHLRVMPREAPAAVMSFAQSPWWR